jgi:hypothetical protein
MAKKIGSDHRVVTLEEPHGGHPRLRTTGDAMQQQEHWSLSSTPVGNIVAVEAGEDDRELLSAHRLVAGSS